MPPPPGVPIGSPWMSSVGVTKVEAYVPFGDRPEAKHMTTGAASATKRHRKIKKAAFLINFTFSPPDFYKRRKPFSESAINQTCRTP
jgi:hypothetical protein